MGGVTQTNSSNIADADGTTDVFNFTFFAFNTDHVKVYSVLDDVFTELTSGFTITVNAGGAGGNVTFTTPPADAVGSILVRREMPYTQATEFNDLVRSKESSIETALNILALQIQQLKEDVDRSIKYTEGAEATDTTLEAPTDGYALVYDGTTGAIKAGVALEDIETAQTYATAAAASATQAQNYAAALTATSTTSRTMATGSLTLTASTGKAFVSGQYIVVSSDAAPSTNFMDAQITSYDSSTGELVFTVSQVTGSGTYADWTIGLSGPKGETGATGPTGAGTGDMLGSNNLSDLTDAATARGNLGLGSASLADLIDEDDMASDSATDAPSQQSVKAYIDALIASVGGLTESKSSWTAMTAGAASAFNHGFAGQPKIIQLWLKCISSGYGFTADQEFPADSATPVTYNSTRGVVIYDVTSSQVKTVVGTYGYLFLYNPSTGAGVAPPFANFQYQIRAYY